jgi:hypothetical protein
LTLSPPRISLQDDNTERSRSMSWRNARNATPLHHTNHWQEHRGSGSSTHLHSCAVRDSLGWCHCWAPCPLDD